jgi:cytochrome b subunit of formate dehydrogenase
MFLVHFALSVMHPLMRGAINGMLSGWVPEEYIRSHHAMWYEEIAGEQQEPAPPAETLSADQSAS